MAPSSPYLRNTVYGFCPSCSAMYGRFHNADCTVDAEPEPETEAQDARPAPDEDAAYAGIYAWPPFI